MCISFTDLGLIRQEQIWLESVDMAREDGGAWWASRADLFKAYIAEEFTLMSRAALTEHLTDVNERRDPADWASVRALIEAELSSRDNVVDLVPAPQLTPEVAVAA